MMSRVKKYKSMFVCFNAILLKVPAKFSVGLDKLILRRLWKGTGPRELNNLEDSVATGSRTIWCSGEKDTEMDGTE